MKKKLLKMKKKVNNAGMTLIEILVAMALLVVAIIPLSGGFIYSAMNSAKAKHMQQTAVLANTMIENCKAYNVDVIEDMVLDGSFMPNADSSVKDASFTAGDLYYFDDVVVYSDAATGYESSQVYDLSMKIEPIGNPKKLMDYSDMNRYSDAVFIVNETPVDGDTFTAKECDAKAYQHGLELIVSKVNTKITENGWNHTPFTYTDIETSMESGGDNAGKKLELTRTIYIDAKKDDVTGKETVVVKYIYAYDFTGGSFKFIDSVTNDPRQVDVSSLTDKVYEFPIYDNDAMGAGTLENVYLFYYPSYNTTGIEFEKDEIVIGNTDYDGGYDVYIMKQPREDITNVSELNNKESTYAPKVTVDGIYDTDVYHNLSVNLGGGGTTGSLNIDSHVIWKDYDYNNPEPTDPAYDPNYQSLIDEEYKKMMFTVEVAVYPGDSYGVDGGVMGMSQEPVCTLDGTFLNW